MNYVGFLFFSTRQALRLFPCAVLRGQSDGSVFSMMVSQRFDEKSMIVCVRFAHTAKASVLDFIDFRSELMNILQIPENLTEIASPHVQKQVFDCLLS